MAALAWMHFLTVVQLFMLPSSYAQGGLKAGFYSSTCPKAEDTVRATVERYFNDDPSVAPGLLRLHFHDCFVQGCEGSVLVTGNSTEMTAVQNTGLKGFDVVEDAKSQLEALCPGVVSCADILALAARDAVDLAGGPSWSVPTGRRDGRVSSASDAASLPSPFDSVEIQRQKFQDKGLSDQDLVTLVGAHTIGQTSCRFVGYRLYNFTATGNADPTINQDFLEQLQTQCPQDGNPSQRVPLDKDTPAKFDVNFFKNIRDGRGVLESDQRLWGHEATRAVVKKYSGTLRGVLGLRFGYEFQKSMVKLSGLGVKTGNDGEIRKVCSSINTCNYKKGH
ncbi:hypothetical protein Taro_005824 [Colocasia esculenta]|uniref:Peroxidase n=1 Tax=Colocasia esculenta TaxID=4460 RepID=A0A843TQX1_COLES|nr:hypothetical protein [Colocasia esculenta]